MADLSTLCMSIDELILEIEKKISHEYDAAMFSVIREYFHTDVFAMEYIYKKILAELIRDDYSETMQAVFYGCT